MRRLSIVLVFLMAAACAGGAEGETPVSGSSSPSVTTTTLTSPSPSSSSTVTFEAAKVLIDTGEGSVLIDAEKAETSEQHALGLMNRTSLPDDAGMVFLFFEERTGGFWMKNTLIPLSIAFFDTDGKIVRILDMEPCEADPCEIYDPGVPYAGALEVNQGAFREWGVKEGDRITVTH